MMLKRKDALEKLGWVKVYNDYEIVKYTKDYYNEILICKK